MDTLPHEFWLIKISAAIIQNP